MERLGLPNGIFIGDSNALIEITGAAKKIKDDFVYFGLSTAILAKADIMYVTIYDDNARYRISENDSATSTIGHYAESGTTIEIVGNSNIHNFSIAASDTKIMVFISIMSTRGVL